jgi:LysM repeat protein
VSRLAQLAVTLLLVAAASAIPAVGAERWHTVAFGDSVSAIAKEYYGDYELADLLLRFNGRRDPRIRPGDRLRIPYCSVHVVRPGDTGSKLAQRYLGRSSAWAAIAELNDLSPTAPLRVGAALVMPVVLRHGLVRGDTLAVLAERHYGDPSRGGLLQSFNRIDDPRELAVGRTIEIPLITLRLAQPPAPAEPVAETEPVAKTKAAPAGESIAKNVAGEAADPAPTATPAPTPAWFDRGFAEAERAYTAGDFDLARTRIAALADRIGSIPAHADRARLWRLTAFVYVAFDRDDDACAAFRSLRSVESPVEFDPKLVSPKIRETFAACETDEDS